MSANFMDTYKRTGLVLADGKGALVRDEDGREYVDFGSGIGVNSLGHAHPALVTAIAAQAGRLIHVSNYYETAAANALSRELCEAAGMEALFLCNSGTEANEAAIKIARKHGNSQIPARTTIVTLRGSFHGRTMGALTATGQDKFHVHFGPFLEGFRHVAPNDLPALEAALSPEVSALFLEPVMGEGGVIPLAEAYLAGAARLCAERGILLVADEVQCGIGRTGALFASLAAGIAPDLILAAKGLAGGVPIGAVLARGPAAAVLGRGDHGSTFGGNPLAAAAARAVLRVILEPGFLAGVAAKGERIRAEVASWKHPLVQEIRGKGLMVGVALSLPPDRVKELALAEGLLILTAGEDALRLLPPLVITEAELERGLKALRRALDAALAEAGS
jgi:acetylornithine/N-succinyldiaminopimelate aminotransferase